MSTKRILAGIVSLLMVVSILPAVSLADGPAEYAPIAAMEELVEGDYVIYDVRDTYEGVMSNTLNGGKMEAAAPTFSGENIVTSDESVVWHISLVEGVGCTIYNAAIAKYVEITNNSTSGFTLADEPTMYYTAELNEDGTFDLYNPNINNRGIGIYQTNFRCYTLDGANYAPGVKLYKRVVDSVSGVCGAEGDNVTWTLDLDTGTLVISGSGDMFEFPLADDVPWIQYITQINAVQIESGVTSIGRCAFHSCSALTSVSIPYGVTFIGDYAFYNCNKLTEIVIPNSVTGMGRSVFDSCSMLASVTLSDSITSIGEYTFANCGSLTGITLPNGLIRIGTGAFACSGLYSVTIPAGVTSIGSGAFHYCSDLAVAVFLSVPPAEFGDYVFDNCAPNFVIRFPNQLFDQWTPNGESTWNGYPVLADNSLGAVVTGVCGADGDNLTWTLSFDTGVLVIAGSGAMMDFDSFSNKAPWYDYHDVITAAVLDERVTVIGDYAFWPCRALSSINLPSGVTRIGSASFGFCRSLTYLDIPESVTEIDDWAFFKSGLTSVVIPDSLRTIRDSAFWGCSELASVTIGSGVTSIEESAFLNCTSLTSVTIPAHVASIGSNAFNGCIALSSATFLGAPPIVFDSGVFDGCASDFVIYYTIDHASQWAPNGETEWNGYPIKLLLVGTLGDLDGDGRLTFIDVTTLYMYLVNLADLSPQAKLLADFNGDGSLGYADITAMYLAMLG